MRLIPAQLTFGMVLCRWWVELVSSNMMLRIEIHQTRESCFSESEDPLDAVWQIPCVFDRGEDWVWPHCQKAQIGDVYPFVGFSYQHLWSWSLTRVTLVLGYLSRHGPSPFISQIGWATSSWMTPGCAKLLPFENYGSHWSLGNL